MPQEPQWVKNSDGDWLVYDVQLSGAKKFLPIKSDIYHQGEQEFTDTIFHKFNKDSTAFIQYVWIKKNNHEVKDLVHNVYYEQDGKVQMVSKKILVPKSEPLGIGWPITKGKWIAANAPGMESEHTNTTVKVGAKIFDSVQQAWLLGHNNQRFAIDFVKMDNQGKLFANQGTSNSDWFSYGTSC